MKTKLTSLIFITITSSFLYGYYWLLSDDEPLAEKQEQIQTVKLNLKTPEKISYRVKTDTSWMTSNSTVDFANNIMDEASVYNNLNSALTNLKTDSSIQLPDLGAAANCRECLELLQMQLLSDHLTDSQKAQLAELMAVNNKLSFAALLLGTLDKIVQSGGNSILISALTNSLGHFNSAEVAQNFSQYLSSDRKISATLQQVLANNINQTSNRTQVAIDIAKLFDATDNETVQNRLLAIDHPEALAKIHEQALTEGNTSLANRTLQQLQSNPSPYSMDSILGLLHSSPVDSSIKPELIDAVHQLANRQLSGYRLDYIENRLAQGAYSEEDKLLVFDILAHSEDTVRGTEIIAKFAK